MIFIEKMNSIVTSCTMFAITDITVHKIMGLLDPLSLSAFSSTCKEANGLLTGKLREKLYKVFLARKVIKTGKSTGTPFGWINLTWNCINVYDSFHCYTYYSNRGHKINVATRSLSSKFLFGNDIYYASFPRIHENIMSLGEKFWEIAEMPPKNVRNDFINECIFYHTETKISAIVSGKIYELVVDSTGINISTDGSPFRPLFDGGRLFIMGGRVCAGNEEDVGAAYLILGMPVSLITWLEKA